MGLRSFVAFGAVGAAVLLAAPPAFAAPGDADVSFKVVGNTVVQNAGKPVYVQLFNSGPASAENIVVKVDISGVDTSKLEARAPATCSEPDGGIFLCSVGSLVPGETNTGFSPFDIIAVTDGATGGAGSFTIEVTSDTPDSNGDNNKKVEVPLSVADLAYDFSVTVQDIWAEAGGEPNAVAPGDSAPLVTFFRNFGTQRAVDPVWQVSLPPFVTFVSEDGSSFCTFNQPKTVASCKAAGRGVNPGRNVISLFTVKVAKDAPGPAALAGGIVDGGALSSAEPNDDDSDVGPGSEARNAARQSVGTGDGDPTDNAAFFSAHVSSNPADLAIAATKGSGAVGSVVKITITIENKGPASSPDTKVTVTAPTGTELVDMPTNCEFTTPGKVGTCEGLLSAGEKNSGTFSFKIAATSVADDGKATIEGPLEDRDTTNNSAAIVITIDSGLPITGVKVSVIAGTGVAVLLVGALLFVLARRRRVELVTPSHDA
ncbi:hypothetical protein Voc01_013600 [Virgisporangium ochraceum]|uniref:DUF11 domain-containing protein n=1 Tax=Virgisporangium ochraceum TaxID=65505 RepID=A0A8J3ZR71_9ACTN|nr:hypothetical protein Voc01_013600 [Virgisporangium ochraceum]